jgi:hypothetical protein
MTPVNGNFDEMLRGALHAEVDRLEPAEGGLELIRRRTHAPWLVRQASLMLTECADLVRLIAIRLEPGVTGMRAAIAARGGVGEAFVGVLSSIVASVAALVMPSRRRGAMHRGGAAGSGGPSPERPRSNLGWLRPVLAVVGAVVIVVAGVFGLAQVRDNLVLELFPSNAPASSGAGTSSTGGQVPTLQGHSATGAILPPGTQHGSSTPSPKDTCSSSPDQRAATPTPTPTDGTTTPPASPSDTPTPAPTDTVVPSPTDTAATTALSVNGGTGVQTVVDVAPAATCASPAHSTAAS